MPLLLLLWSFATAVHGQQKPVIYPAKGQGAEQQQKDDGECHVWAKNATGVDPAAIASATPAPSAAPPKAPLAKGAVRGAVGGALVGEIADDNAGGGAAAGAVVGGVRNAQKAKQAQQAQAQQHSQARASPQEAMNAYYRGFSACMEGRGYVLR